MNGMYIKIVPKNGSNDLDFFEKMHQTGICEKFEMYNVAVPVYEFREEFLNHIAEHGLSSLYKFEIVMEDITSPSMTVDEIKDVFLKFVEKLNGVKNLVIIDSYFYASSNNNATSIFSEALSLISEKIENIYFVTNGRNNDNKTSIHDSVRAVKSSISIQDITTDKFHDRFWINPESKKGIVVGTSLNGLGRKIALIDRLQEDDVEEICNLAKQEGVTV
ncbi:MAG: hypothetical protein VSS75_012860 [Candidatus Parabeggiatoa sp.]|nr:hypothetical protein [Candidatus Parabeggiatoa sp.]